MTTGYSELEFDLAKALLDHLVMVFDNLTPARLLLSNVSVLPEVQGIYQLFLDDKLVYIGKTDAESGLRGRLVRHEKKLSCRVGISPKDVTYKAVQIYVFTPMDLETPLIQHYGGPKEVSWNGSGFGANDPGRERDTTAYKDDHFDVLFPIDMDAELHLESCGEVAAADVLKNLKDILPYVFRFATVAPRSRRAHPDLTETIITIDNGNPTTARNVLSDLVTKLPAGWQLTLFPSHVVLYKEDRLYPHGAVIVRS